MARLISQFAIRTQEDLHRRLRLNETTESLFIEFKLDLDRYAAPDANVRREGQLEFCRDVSAFANAMGGCLLVGIHEGSGKTARVALAAPGIDNFDGRRAWMEAAIRRFLVPSAIGVQFHPLSIQGRTVIAINVQPSERTVVVWNPERKSVECYRRTNEGKGEGLHPDQMEAHSMNSRRAAEIMFRRVLAESATKGEREVELASGIWKPNGRAMDPQPYVYLPAKVGTSETLLSEHEFGLAVSLAEDGSPSRPVVRVPFGLLREAWTTTDGKMGLFLHVRIVQRDARLTLEPF